MHSAITDRAELVLREGGRPIIVPWAPVVVTKRRYHWCDPFLGEQGFVCNSINGRNRVMLAQDVLEWDGERWRDHPALTACATCLPKGLSVVGFPALRRLQPPTLEVGRRPDYTPNPRRRNLAEINRKIARARALHAQGL